MSEDQIAEQLRQNVPAGYVTPTPEAPSVTHEEQSSIISDTVDELVLLKLGNTLDVVRPSKETTEQLKFIYDQLRGEDNSYDAILARLNDYLVKLGFSYRPDRFMRLYLWMKLNQEQIALAKEMQRVQFAA